MKRVKYYDFGVETCWAYFIQALNTFGILVKLVEPFRNWGFMPKIGQKWLFELYNIINVMIMGPKHVEQTLFKSRTLLFFWSDWWNILGIGFLCPKLNKNGLLSYTELKM